MFNFLIKHPSQKPSGGGGVPGAYSLSGFLHEQKRWTLLPSLSSLSGVIMLRFYVSIDLGNGCVFGCTLVLISLEYTLGWNATVSTVITSDMWQRGHYSCYRMCSWLWPAVQRTDGRLPRKRRTEAQAVRWDAKHVRRTNTCFVGD